MQQVLVTLPIFKSWFPPDGVPLYGFGAMLFLVFASVTLWGAHRAKKLTGLAPERFQDMVIWLFVTGIVGARLLYMLQYANQFPDRSLVGLASAFFKIWEGGIVFYGSAIGGAFGYGLFYWFVLRRLKIDGWRLADAVAPLLALGLAIGRIGCYLNGCCWGQVACEECQYVPLGASHFPLLPAHARPSLVRDSALQTTTGFTLAPRGFGGVIDEPRARVRAVEIGSPAERAGVLPDDLVVRVNARTNALYLDLSGPDDKVKAAVAAIKGNVGEPEVLPNGRVRLAFEEQSAYLAARLALDGQHGGVEATSSDLFDDVVRDWPRGKKVLELTVLRNNKEVELPAFAPETVGLFPTQLYETLSMVLLVLFLLAYYPFRRHDGQLMTVLMVCYALHRFVNESLRIEPSYAGGLTLSQWISVLILVPAAVLELYLWRTQPSRRKGEPLPA
jgi:prolipoprotein diacylglyceryltransferase